MTGSIASAFQQVPAIGRYRDCAEVTRQVKPLEPLYLFCRETLAQRAQAFLQGFPGAVSYAVKANSEARILATLQGSGVRHFDVASLAEVATVASCCPGAMLHFNNPVKPEEAIREAYLRFGVRSFALDELAELEKLWQCTAGDRDVVYSVRFKLDHAGAAYDFGSKFGTDAAGAVALLREIRRRGARPALAFHPGSQCTDPQMYARYIAAAAHISRAADVELALLNVGGGFAEAYCNSSAPLLGDYFAAIADSFQREAMQGVPLICEPGRAMVAGCVSLLTRVAHRRGDGQTLFLNDGVYGGLQEQSIVDIEFPVRVWREGQRVDGPFAPFHCFGPTCDPVDRLVKPLRLPVDIRCGDYIEFGLLGAYGSATATRFNGFHSTSYVDVEAGWQY
ncbi:hypothetical protein [Haliea sp. E17]|uniref:hypothetical protein n=1 Tax=Haliea sp. E17 TaxID=3401576 RepID=UPI003AB0BD29